MLSLKIKKLKRIVTGVEAWTDNANMVIPDTRCCLPAIASRSGEASPSRDRLGGDTG